MKYREYTKIAVAILILCTGIVYIVILYASSFYANALARAHTYEEIRIGDSTYVVTGGSVTRNGKIVSGLNTFRALRLAYTKVLAERSPILALPGVDLPKLGRALHNLRTEQDFLASMQTNSTEARLVSTALYPVQFLETASSLEQARQRFIASGNESDATEYAGLLKETISAYQRDLKRFDKAFQTIIPSGARPYGTLTSTLDRASMVRAFASLEIGSREAGRKVFIRDLCTHAIVVLCDETNLHLPQTASSSHVEPANDAFSREVVTMYKSAAYPLGNTPVVTLSSSMCIPSTMSASFTFVRYGTSTPEAYLTPFYAGNIILINSRRYTSSPFYKYFNDNDIQYVLVDPLTYYECPVALNDFSSTLTTLAIANFAKNNEASPYLAGASAGQIEMLRSRLTGSALIEHDAASYISALSNALPYTRKTQQLHHSLEDFALALSYKTAGLSELISTIALFESGNRMIASGGVAFDTGAKNLFYTRSGFGSLFLTTHPNIVGIDQSVFPPTELNRTDMPYEYFSDLRAVQGIKATIQSDLKFFWRAHYRK